MKYTQPHRKYHGGVLTDSAREAFALSSESHRAPYTDKLPSVTITEMYYDYRVTDGWKSVKPSNFVYPKARTLIKEYQREYKEKLADIATVELDD